MLYTQTTICTHALFYRSYFIGGSQQEKEFFYLDLSKPFNTSNAPWLDLTINGDINLTRYNFATSVFNAFDGPIYYIGGEMTQPSDPFIYVFDILNEVWFIPGIKTPPQQRVGFQAVIYERKIYIFVGPES